MKKIKICLSSLLVLFASSAFSWGGRGHATICETAVFLVKDPVLKEYLTSKPHVMGHLCNIPDTHWKNLGGEINRVGSPTHYIDIEVLGMSLKEIPADYQKIVDDFTGKPNKFKAGATVFSVPQEFGSSWWRVDQFLRRITALKAEFAQAKAPQNRKEEQDEKFPFNQAVHSMIVNMGLMGHFVGDASQPLHTTADYDGWASGHGGIHVYYEDEVVSAFDGDLHQQILKSAREMKNPGFLKPLTPVEKMRAFSELSFKDLSTLFQKDPMTEKSKMSVENGMELKTPAKRKPATAGLKLYSSMIVTQMARSAVLLAAFWDESFKNAGQPDLSKYKSYKFPFTPDFVAPDYYVEKKTEEKKSN